MTTATHLPMRSRKKNKKRLAILAKDARHTLEALLEGLGWPKDEGAFHRCIDRLLQIEEDCR